MYMYEQEDWPRFRWDDKAITDLLLNVRFQQGRLIGGMQSIGFHLRNESILETLTQDIVKTSEIEGEILDLSLVRSSVARRLGMETAAAASCDKNVDGVVDMMLDATQNFHEKITKERLMRWHAALFPYGRSGFSPIQVGKWRKGVVQVVSGLRGEETVHYEAPPADRVDQEMTILLNWLNEDSPIDPVIKAALAHFWFVTIHPFDDGNGRVARALGDLFLARSENSSHRFYSLSAQIQKERKGYYAILERSQKGSMDVTDWLQWFLRCLARAIDSALSTLDVVVHKALFWESLAGMPLNERQRKLINILLDGLEGKLNSSKWAKIAKCSQDTAHRDIMDLVERNILVKNAEGGRSTSYSLAKLAFEGE